MAVTLFGFGLTFSLLIPLLCPIMLILTLVVYYIDKYNLIFVYPIEFDSQLTNRETLVRFSILSIIFFQLLMIAYLVFWVDNVYSVVMLLLLGF